MIGLLLAVTIIAFASGSFIKQEVLSLKNNIKQEEVKSANTEENSLKNSGEEDQSAKIDIKIENNSKSTKTNEDVVKEKNIFQFQYPGARVVSSTSESLLLRSIKSPEEVTNWYKEKIKSNKLAATSFVATSTNGKVVNKLSASGNFKIEVAIKNENSETEINVNLTN